MAHSAHELPVPGPPGDRPPRPAPPAGGGCGDLPPAWTERDPRVPARRQIDADGRPSVADIAEQLRAEVASTG